jgi:hypothetical protein
MKSRIQLLAVAALALLGGAALAAEQPVAQSNSPQADASLYGESVMLPKQAAVCAERIADYMPRFRRAYEAWHDLNAAHLANGSKLIHDQAKVGGVDADAGLDKLAEPDIERLRKTSIEMLARHCELILESMAPPATN